MEITKERQGELAMMCFKLLLKKKGIRINDQFKREIGDVAKQLGVEREELETFLRPIMQEMFDEMFNGSPEDQQAQREREQRDRKNVKNGHMTEETFEKLHKKPYTPPEE